MNIEQKQKQVLDAMEASDSYGGVIIFYADDVCLDGHFTVEELKGIIAAMPGEQ